MKPILFSLLILPLAAFAESPDTATSVSRQNPISLPGNSKAAPFSASVSTGIVVASNPSALHLHPNSSDIGSGYRPQR